MNFILTLLFVVVIMVLVMFALAIQVIFKKSHKFPNTHIGGNEHLQKEGVTCAKTWDKMEQQKVKEQLKYKNLTLIKK